MEKELEEQRHKNKMQELTYARESEKLKHGFELERVRITMAETKKNIERKHYFIMEQIQLRTDSIRETRR